MENWNKVPSSLSIIEVGLDSISSITFKDNKGIDPKLLVCSLCYCINFNGKQCKNKKCLKRICETCYIRNINSSKEYVCPFCRIANDVVNTEYAIESLISSLLFFCKRSKFCTGKYTFTELIKYHLHNEINKNVNNTCPVCSKSLNELNYDVSKCNNCLRLGCYKQKAAQNYKNSNCMTRW